MIARLSVFVGVFALVSCAEPATPDATDDGLVDEAVYEPDPDVNTYVPDGYRPTEPVRVITLGDSITAGIGASSTDLTYTSLLMSNASSTWPSFDGDALDSLFGSLEWVDVSVSGATTTSLINDQLPALERELGASASGETIVVITIGGNDMQRALLPLMLAQDKEAAYLAEIAPAVDNFTTIVEYFQDAARFPDGVKLYMTNVYEPTDDEGQAQGCFLSTDIGLALPFLDRANDKLRELAVDRGFAMIDLNGHFEGHGHNHEDAEMATYDAEDPTLWLIDDCIHPNDRGHHEVRRLFLTAIDARPLERDRGQP